MFRLIWKKCYLTLFLIGLFILNQLPVTVAYGMIQYGELGNASYFIIALELIVLFIFILYANHQQLFHWRSFIMSKPFKILLFSYLASLGFNILGSLILQLEGIKTTANQSELEMIMSKLPAVFMFLSVGIAAPIEEEIMFRYIVPKKLFEGHQKIGFVIGTLLFTLGHVPTDLGSFVIYFGMGSVLTYLYYRYQRMEYNVSLHLFNNCFAFLLIIANLG